MTSSFSCLMLDVFTYVYILTDAFAQSNKGSFNHDTLTQSGLELQTLQLEDHPLYLLNPRQPLFNECSSKASQ